MNYSLQLLCLLSVSFFTGAMEKTIINTDNKKQVMCVFKSQEEADGVLNAPLDSFSNTSPLTIARLFSMLGYDVKAVGFSQATSSRNQTHQDKLPEVPTAPSVKKEENSIPVSIGFVVEDFEKGKQIITEEFRNLFRAHNHGTTIIGSKDFELTYRDLNKKDIYTQKHMMLIKVCFLRLGTTKAAWFEPVHDPYSIRLIIAPRTFPRMSEINGVACTFTANSSDSFIRIDDPSTVSNQLMTILEKSRQGLIAHS